MLSGKATSLALLGFVWLAIQVAPAKADVKYTITDLNAPIATGINNSGQVVGQNSAWIAFLWTQGVGMQNLGSLPNSEATAINNNGQIAGWTDSTEGRDLFLYTSSAGMKDLGRLPGTDGSRATGINASGQIVGYCLESGSSSQAFIYSSATGMTALGNLPGETHSVATGINDSGQVVGGCSNHAFLYTVATGMTDLGFGSNSGATAINNSGQILGGTNALNSTVFIYTIATGGKQYLNKFPGALDITPVAINNNGEVVGQSDILSEGVFTKHAYVYTSDAGSLDLNTLIDPTSGWTLQSATALNDNGQIVGYGLNSAGQQDAFLLTPTPEPATLSLLAMGAMGLLRRNRRAYRVGRRA